MQNLRLSKNGRMSIKGINPINALQAFLKEDGSYSFPICGDIVRRLYDQVEDLNVDPALMDILREVSIFQKETRRIAALNDSPGREELLPYQRVGSGWLRHVRKGILADEQGLGKTVISLDAAEQIQPHRPLILCSKTKCDDWRTHVQDWTSYRGIILDGDAIARIDTIHEWGGFLIANYTTALLHSDLLAKADLIIMDEAHKVRNKRTQTFKILRTITRRMNYVFAVTASPNINEATDLWTLLSLVDPKRFASYWGFAYRFCIIIPEYMGVKVGGVREDERDNLRRMLSSYVLMREGMLDLPDPTWRVFHYEMSDVQKRLYRRMDAEGIAEYKGSRVEALLELSKITRLRQIALHPRLALPNYDGPSKLDALLEIIEERDGQVIIFSQYAEMVTLAAKFLRQNGVTCCSLTGKMTDRARRSSLAEFKSGNARAISMTFGVGGEGLNLTEADRAIFLELAWHPAGMQHATKRILRHGQKSPTVEFISIHIDGTIEDHIREIVRSKKRVTIQEILRRKT